MTREHEDFPAQKGPEMADVHAHLQHARATTSNPWPKGVDDIRVLRDIYGLSLREALSVLQENANQHEEAG